MEFRLIAKDKRIALSVRQIPQSYLRLAGGGSQTAAPFAAPRPGVPLHKAKLPRGAAQGRHYAFAGIRYTGGNIRSAFIRSPDKNRLNAARYISPPPSNALFNPNASRKLLFCLLKAAVDVVNLPQRIDCVRFFRLKAAVFGETGPGRFHISRKCLRVCQSVPENYIRRIKRESLLKCLNGSCVILADEGGLSGSSPDLKIEPRRAS